MYNTDSVASHATTDAGYDFLITKPNTRAATVVVRNTGEKSAKVQLQGSIRSGDEAAYVEVLEEETVAAGAAVVFSVTDYWPYLRVVGKPAAEGEQTTLHVESASVDS